MTHLPESDDASAMRVESAEFVLPGHPDRLCDALADAIVEHVMRGDALGQCGVEVACVFDRVFVTGRVASTPDVLARLDIPALARRTYREAGYGADAAGFAWGPDPDALRVDTALCRGAFAPGEREHRHFADDQAICVGYANAMADTHHLPPAHWLANRIGRELFRLRRARGAGEVGPDGKVLAQVVTDGTRWRPLRVSISLNHHAGSDWLLLRRLADAAVDAACAGRPRPEILVNGAGMFVAGGPNGDNGTTGKKLVVDAYGPTVPIGGGAWSGKDFNKVDRLGGFLAREIALDTVRAHGGEALVEVRYEPGGAGPQSMRVEVRAAGGAVRARFDLDVDVPRYANAAVAARLRGAVRGRLAERARWGFPLEAPRRGRAGLAHAPGTSSALRVLGGAVSRVPAACR